MKLNRKFFEKARVLLCAALIVAAVQAEAAAFMSAGSASVPAPAAAQEEGIMPLAEKTEWYYRYYNGQRQKRLWSLTRGIWLTDWINF